MTRFNTYALAREAHGAWLGRNGIANDSSQKLILERFDHMLVAKGSPDYEELAGIAGENLFYYDADSGILYTYSRFDMGGPLYGLAPVEKAWRVVSTLNDATGEQHDLPILQYYYDLYHAEPSV